MFKCEVCGAEFVVPEKVTESRPLGFESYNACPMCKGTSFELYNDDVYEPDLAEISKDIIKGIYELNKFRDGLTDLFGSKCENKIFENAYNRLLDALDKITAAEGMDIYYVQDKILKAKSEFDLNIAIRVFLDGAGL